MKDSMTTELEIFEDLIASVIDGSYDEKKSDSLFLEKCDALKEDAEIYSALHPDKSAYYLIQRKLIVYRIVAKMSKEAVKLNEQQKNKLEFIEEGLLGLYWLYMELLVEKEDY